MRSHKRPSLRARDIKLTFSSLSESTAIPLLAISPLFAAHSSPIWRLSGTHPAPIRRPSITHPSSICHPSAAYLTPVHRSSNTHPSSICRPSDTHLASIWQPSGALPILIYQPSNTHLGPIWRPSATHQRKPIQHLSNNHPTPIHNIHSERCNYGEEHSSFAPK